MSHKRLIFAIVVILTFVIAGMPVAAQDGPTSDPTDPLIAYVQGWQAAVLTPTEVVMWTDVAEYKSPTFIWHDPNIPAVSDSRNEYFGLDFANIMRAVAPGGQFTFERIVRYGELVWVQYAEDMTLIQPPPYEWAYEPWSHMHLPMDLHAESVFIARFEDGKIAEWWEYSDNPLIHVAFDYFQCTGFWSPPFSAREMRTTDVADVPDHTLLMEGEKITLVQQLIDRTINDFQPGYGTMMKSTLIVHEPRGPDVRVVFPGSIRKWFEALHQLMPDYHMEVQHIVEYEDMVWVHWRAKGTLTNPTTDPGLMALNTQRMPRPLEMEGVYLFRFEDDRIAEMWWYEDNPLLTLANRGPCLARP